MPNFTYFRQLPSLSPLPSLIACVSLACTSPAFAAEDCKLNGQEVSLNNGATTEGKTGIIRCTDRENGKLTREREIKNGKIYGLNRLYRDGILSLEFTDEENGQRHGLTREYSDKGTLIREEREDHGRRSGIQRVWFDDGKLKAVEFIGESDADNAKLRWNANGSINELKCGTIARLAPHADDEKLCGFNGKLSSVSLFNDKAQLKQTEAWLKGELQQAKYFEARSGTLSASYERKDKEGIETQFYAEGGKRSEVVFKANDRRQLPILKRSYHERGTLIEEQRYADIEFDGRPVHYLAQERLYFLNGQLKSEENRRFEGRNEVLELKSFHDNGKLSSVTQHLVVNRYTRRPIGVHQYFTQQGTLYSENHYDNKGNLFRQKRWTADGVLEADEEVFEDGSRRAFTK